MMAVTVVCDEKSMVDKAHEWGHSLPPHKAGSNNVGCSSAPSALAQGRLSRKAREGAHPQLFGQMLKTNPRFTSQRNGPPAVYVISGGILLASGYNELLPRLDFCF